MDNRFIAYNPHRHAPDQLWTLDHHLQTLKQQIYLYESPLINELPSKETGVYTIGGGRQIGKTTLLKQWIAKLIQQGIDPLSIAFFTGELIDNHHALVDILQNFILENGHHSKLYIIIDEITYVKNWDKGIKFLADAGLFQKCIVILTGSDLTLMQAARMAFPGRRGRAEKVDFHVYPLSFKEFLGLKKLLPEMNGKQMLSTELTNSIYQEFDNYLKHGGYLTAINDMAKNGEITLSTLKIYSDWIRGDISKRGKQENYLREIILAIIQRYNKQVSWHALADAVSIDSHKTVADYCQLLSTMDALFIQEALLIDKLVAAPKKARKLNFTDPFIYHALKFCFSNQKTTAQQQIEHDIQDPNISSEIVEAVVSNHYRRRYPTYYLKTDSEIDLAYVDGKNFYPIEIKWRNQLRPKDIKFVKQYKNARIFSKTRQSSNIDGINIIPLPIALLGV